tara:strand:+ start:26127 stop:27674 length:1548 start_codon:yes stop_codon:yes gene_type:complete
MLEFGELKPDLPPLLNDGLTRAEGVLPKEIGYKPVPVLTDLTTTAIDARPQGMFSARDPAAVGTTYVFVGDISKLYELSNVSWNDVSGATYTTTAEGRWEFVLWDNLVIATNFADVIQVKTLGSGNFAALGGTPPQARHIGIVRDFVVVGNTFDGSDGNKPNRVRWSGIDDETSWTVAPSTQADFQDLQNNGGWIQAIVGGDYGTIFQEFAITRMTYIGSPLVFQFDQIESERGAYAPGGVIPVGDNIAYLSSDGFYVFDGRQSIPIGDGKINDAFFAATGLLAHNRNYIDRISSANYPNEQILCWSYSSVNADAEGECDIILFYNYSPGGKTRWSVLRTNDTDAQAGSTNINHFVIGNSLQPGYTLEGLDAVSTSIDALPFSLDSPVWAGQNKSLSAVTDDLQLALFDSTTNTYYDAFIETGERQLNPHQRTSISMLRPFVDDVLGNANISVALSGRDTELATASFSNTVTLNSSGFANVRSNARFHRAYIKITSGFSSAEGIDVIQSAPVGRR